MPKPYRKNPRKITQKQLENLESTLAELGDLSGIVHDLNTDEIIGGNQRSKVFDLNECEIVLTEEYAQADEQGTVGLGFVVWRGKHYAYRAVRWDERTAERANIVANRAGGEWDFEMLATEFSAPDLVAWGFEPGEVAFGMEVDETPDIDFEIDKNAKPNPRNLPIDVIFCWGGGDNSCCIPIRGGWMYGVRSGDVGVDGKGICPMVATSPRHKVVFVDNDFHKYDHNHHAQIVKELRPKYATVRDIMTPQQCKEAGIDFYSLEQVLAWAEELNQYAENVIVIPKYDCLDLIPEKFMLGYSVPTAYGGTPLPPEIFKGRRVHLLGGSWKAQLAHMAILGDDVVSLDNNHIHIVASQWGQFCDKDGNTKQMQNVGFGDLVNVRDSAMCLSVGLIGAKVKELYGASDAV